MSLSHTHHHLSPGCPIGRPQRARAEEREQGGQPQHKQKVEETRTHRSVLLKTTSGQQGKYQMLDLDDLWRKLGHIISPQNEQQWLWEQWLSHFCIRKGRKPGWLQRASVRFPRLETHLWFPSDVWPTLTAWNVSVSLLTVWITAILLTIFVLVEWELSCKDESLFTFVSEWLRREREHGANRCVIVMQTKLLAGSRMSRS